MNAPLPDPRPYFAELEDPRRETRNKLHKLGDIVMIVFCAVLSGIEDWVGMEDFALEKEGWFRRFLELPNGIPSHDTLSDVMGRLKPGAFAELMLRCAGCGRRCRRWPGSRCAWTANGYAAAAVANAWPRSMMITDPG